METATERIAPRVSRRMRGVLACILAIGASLAFPQRSRAVELPGAQTQVTISKGASLDQVLAAFRQATGLPCIAQAPSSEIRTDQAFSGDLDLAARFVSRVLDYRVEPRPGVLLFYGQYTRANDYPVLSPRELEGITDDLYRVVRTFQQPPVTGSVIGDQDALIASFTAEQIRLLQDGGLPVATLRAPQARLWSAINADFVYGDASERLRRLSECFKHGNQCEMFSYQRLPADGPQLGLRFPQANALSGQTMYLIPGATGGPTQVAVRRSDHTVLRERHNRLPARFDRRLALPAGAASLESLFTAVRTATGSDVGLPSAAGRYQFVTSGGALSGRNLVDAMTEMNGWRCDPDAKGRYVLVRPRFGAARTPAELHYAVTELVPPCLTLLATQSLGSALFWERGQVDAVRRAYSPAELAAGVKVTDLSADLQDRVAQALSLDLLRQLFYPKKLLNPGAGPAFMLAPETGVLHVGMSGTNQPAVRTRFISKGQFLSVTVQRPDGGTDMWGWGIGTAHVQP